MHDQLESLLKTVQQAQKQIFDARKTHEANGQEQDLEDVEMGLERIKQKLHALMKKTGKKSGRRHEPPSGI
jgi:hypothetical protein